MRILVITTDSRWVDAVREAFPTGCDVIAGDPHQLRNSVALLPVIDACFVAEAELGSFTIDALKQLSVAGEVALFALSGSVRPEWEEPALIAGARQVFRAPLRPGVAQLSISRAIRPATSRVHADVPERIPLAAPTASARDGRELSLLREFSQLLVQGPSQPGFATAFLRTLREALGSGRLLFYRRTAGADAALVLEAAIGIDRQSLDGFRFHLGHGLGRILSNRAGAILRDRLRAEHPDEAVARREMGVCGAELAIPLVTADGFVGLVLVGARIAGTEYSDYEITQVYHLMETFAAALVREAASRPDNAPVEFPAVLHDLPLGCALLDAELRVVDANAAFRNQLDPTPAEPAGSIRLTPEWADTVRQLQRATGGEARIEIDHVLAGAVRRLRLSVRRCDSAGRWWLLVEDLTTETRLRHELHERNVHNVLQRAGEQLSNDFRNALTPIEILVQLSREAGTRHDLDRLRVPVSSAIHRLRRRVDDLGYLTKTSILAEPTSVAAVFRSARERLDNWLDAKQLKTLIWSGEFSSVSIVADTAAVGLAVAELVVNAVEAASGQPVTITAEDLPEAVLFKIRNPGEWRPPGEEAGLGHRAFVTSKSGGVGLGVEVASRVAEYHGGRLVLGPVSSDAVEAVLRIPRHAAAVVTAEDPRVPLRRS